MEENVPSYDGTSTDYHVFENVTEKPLPIDMRFNDGHKLAITLYTILMVLSAIGNITVLYAIIRLSRKGKLSRINILLLNLTIADLLVTFVMMPLEAWKCAGKFPADLETALK
ncbi:unnamed protein product [Orchesella dallaii]|uniref:G-protein coupled receptors family 1 profile domain-containing protein n=1 Tax=Orchesella dallaii TaxID=48710 RepID=A0ABP1RVY0_9HEXA